MAFCKTGARIVSQFELHSETTSVFHALCYCGACGLPLLLFLVCVVAYLFPVVQAFVVVLEHGLALPLALVVLGGSVYDVAGEHLLPEGKAAGGTWWVGGLGSELGVLVFCAVCAIFVGTPYLR